KVDGQVQGDSPTTTLGSHLFSRGSGRKGDDIQHADGDGRSLSYCFCFLENVALREENCTQPTPQYTSSCHILLRRTLSPLALGLWNVAFGDRRTASSCQLGGARSLATAYVHIQLQMVSLGTSLESLE
ncbi:hypothetical protein VIGAN_UM043000, partial [Vigna angularis var. angularis]